MSRGFGDLAVLLPTIWAMNQVDFTNPDNVQLVRIAFSSVTAVLLALWSYIYIKASSSTNAQKIKVPKGQSGFGMPARYKYRLLRKENDKKKKKENGERKKF